MKNTTEKRLNEIKARCNEARGGPWTSFIEGRDFTGGSSVIRIGTADSVEEDLYLVGDEAKVPSADFDFIAHARQDIPFLLDEIERLNQQLKK